MQSTYCNFLQVLHLIGTINYHIRIPSIIKLAQARINVKQKKKKN